MKGEGSLANAAHPGDAADGDGTCTAQVVLDGGNFGLASGEVGQVGGEVERGRDDGGRSDRQRDAILELVEGYLLGLPFPLAEEVGGKAVGIVVDKFRAVLAEPDAVVDAGALFGSEGRIVAWAAGGGRGDVGGDAEVESSRGLSTRATGRFAAGGVGAAEVDTAGQSV